MAQLAKKGDIIINPETQRPVRVGSRTWLNLVKKGVCQGQYADPNVVYELQEGEGEHMEQLKAKYNQTLPRGKQAVKGRGRHRGKLVVRNKALDPEDVSRYTAKKAISAISENMDELSNLSTEELEAKLEQLILGQLVSEKKSGKKVGFKPKKQPEEQYELQEMKEDEEEDEDEDDDDDDDDALSD